MEQGFDRRGQISLFIALGLIILGAVGVMLYVISWQLTESQQDTQREVASGRHNADAVERLVLSCLEEQALKALQLVGEQGGVIYSAQRGSYSEANTLLFNHLGKVTRVRYAIVPNPAMPAPPMYPYNNPTFSLGKIEQQFANFSFWGQAILPALCERSGPNRPDNPNGYLSCPSQTYGLDKTIQQQLARYVSMHIQDCVDPQLSPFGALAPSPPHVEVVLGAADVTFLLDYPIQIDGAQIGNQTLSVPVRLKRVYELAARMIDAEVKDVRFHKGLDFRNLRDCSSGSRGSGATNDYCWDSSLQVRIMRSIQGEDDILHITDTLSKLDDTPFVFQVAIKNRRPMLDHIYLANGEGVDLVGHVGENLTIVPYGYDADEDVVTYTYALWPETENATFLGGPLCGDPRNVSCTAQDTSVMPRRWSLSAAYRNVTSCGGVNAGQRCASVELGLEDVGRHQVRVSVMDDTGSDDYQVIDVLVLP